MQYLKNISLLLISIFIFSMSAYSSNDLLIISIINPKNLGDAGQVRGIMHVLEQKLKNDHKTYVAEEVECDRLEHAITLLKKHNGKSLVLSSGNTGGMEALQTINKTVDNVFSVYISHQLFQNHTSILKTSKNTKGVDLIVLPKHSINKSWNRLASEGCSEILYTTGVPHNLWQEELEQEYAKYPNLIPAEPNSKFTVVILGGDAQNPDKSWSYYTKKDAAILAKNMSKYLDKDSYLIVLNGPRTGKFNPESGEEDKDAHRIPKLDLVTESFAEYFKDRAKTYVFDFQYGKPSISKAVLGNLLYSSKSSIWVPGESTSMISEIIDNFSDNPKYQIMVYKHKAMNEIHKKHVMTEYRAGRINIVNQDGSVKKQISISKSKPKAASELVADKIMEMCIGK